MRRPRMGDETTFRRHAATGIAEFHPSRSDRVALPRCARTGGGRGGSDLGAERSASRMGLARAAHVARGPGTAWLCQPASHAVCQHRHAPRDRSHDRAARPGLAILHRCPNASSRRLRRGLQCRRDAGPARHLKGHYGRVRASITALSPERRMSGDTSQTGVQHRRKSVGVACRPVMDGAAHEPVMWPNRPADCRHKHVRQYHDGGAQQLARQSGSRATGPLGDADIAVFPRTRHRSWTDAYCSRRSPWPVLRRSRPAARPLYRATG